ncbi:hypothetical protein QTG54_005164 [Skeletonema marinoi]|uniref:Uncharacterized protein n=1 Tax=Skeletonema marinoi TaxID=267567 RepID=A0AAD8YGC1_9STRA|nr:hypothetical protein QTG54_005164 [Skeletonema marinoi]
MMNGNNSDNKGSQKETEKKSTQLAGFAPASRGTTSMKSSSSASGAAQASSSTAAAPSASSDGNNVDTTNRITTTKKKAAATKKRSKSSSKAIAAAGGSSGGIDTTATHNNHNSNETEDTTIQPIDPSSMNSSSFQPMSLSQIQLRIKLLLDKLPSALPEVPPDYINPDETIHNNNNQQSSLYHPPIKSFASALQTTIEEYNLLLSLVSSATYQWGVDRSGASQQNLSVMNSELQQCQEVITSVVSGRLSNVLCPAVDVLVGRVEVVKGGNNGGEENGSSSKKRKLDTSSATTTSNNATTDRLLGTTATINSTTTTNEQRINHYTRPLVDPSYVHLCHQIVARNGEMLRYTLATCIHTAQRVIGDYLEVMKKDVGHEANKGGYY